MKIVRSTFFRGAGIRNRIAIAALLLGCGCFSAEASEPPAAPTAGANPQVLQFRILAGMGTDELVCERAKALEEKETELGRPWSTEVYRDPNLKKDVSARWYRCDADFAKSMLENRDLLFRRLPDKTGGAAQYEVLVLADNFDIKRDDFESVSTGIDNQGSPCVLFAMTPAGAKKLFTLTSRRLPVGDGNHSYMAIMVDEKVISAPRLYEAISSRGQITGNFTMEEVEQLVKLCNIVAQKPTETDNPKPTGTGAATPSGTSILKPTGTGNPKPTGAGSTAPKVPGAKRP